MRDKTTRRSDGTLPKLCGILRIVFTVLIVLLSLFILIPRFSVKEAAGRSREIRDFNEGWTLTREDGTQEEVTLPVRIPVSQGGRGILSHPLRPEDSNRALSFCVTNGALKVFSGGVLVLETGQGKGTGQAGGGEGKAPASGIEEAMREAGEDPSSEEALSLSALSELPESESVFRGGYEQAGRFPGEAEYLIDLGEISDRKTLIIDMEAIRSPGEIAVGKAFIARRDIAFTRRLRSCVFDLVCAVFLLFGILLLVLPKLVRGLVRTERRGLIRLALLGGDLMLFVAAGSGLLPAFFGNRAFFSALETLTFLMIPGFLMAYYCRYDTSRETFHLRRLLWISVVTAFAQMLLILFQLVPGVILEAVTLFFILLSVTLLAFFLIGRRKAGKPSGGWPECLTLFCFFAACLLHFLSRILPAVKLLPVLSECGLTLVFSILCLREMVFVLREYRSEPLPMEPETPTVPVLPEETDTKPEKEERKPVQRLPKPEETVSAPEAKNAELEKLNSELDKTQSELKKTQSELKKTKAELDKTKADLEKEKEESERSAKEREEKNRCSLPDHLPEVEGLDWQYAWLHWNEEEHLKEALKQFAEEIPLQAKALSGCYDGLPDTRKMQEYSLQARKMKEAAGSLGIVPLAGMASLLEKAAAHEDLSLIMSCNKAFLDSWNSYQEKLSKIFV